MSHDRRPHGSFVAPYTRIVSLLALMGAAALLPACGGDGPTGTDGDETQEATQLVFAVQPSDATAGEAIAPAVVVAVQDASGRTVTSSTASVTVALEDNPGGASLGGTTTVSTSGGEATFSNLSLEAAADGYTLRATADGLDGDVSAAFRIAPAAASRLAFATGPSDAEGQEPISPAVEVAVQDEFGNTVTGSTASVDLALADDPTGGEVTLSGATATSASDGVATFDDLSLDRPAEGFTLEATASDLPAVTSDPFAVRLTFVQTSAGGRHTCGVTTADHAYCWGSNSDGQLGDGTRTNRTAPVPVSGGLSFARVSAGGTHTCGVTTTNEAFCWGFNSSGQLGNGDDTGADQLTPATVSTTESFARVSAGFAYTCGVTTADEAFCWGENNSDQLGDGSGTDQFAPVAVSTTESFARVAAGEQHTCGVTTADEAFCWGNNANGQLGDGSTDDRSTPVAVSTTEAFVQVSAGAIHTCGATTADEAFCWGGNFNSQLGDGSTDNERTEPVAVDVSGLSTGTFARVVAGETHTCGVTTADEAYCWGDNEFGQVGDGTTGNERAEPVAVSTTESFARVTGGGDHTCGVSTADEAFCWGVNLNGQLGDGSNDDSSTPVRVVQ